MLEITNESVKKAEYIEEEQTNEVAKLYYDKAQVWPPITRTYLLMSTDKPTTIHVDINHTLEYSADGNEWKEYNNSDKTISFDRNLRLRAFKPALRCNVTINQTGDSIGSLSTDAMVSVSGQLQALVDCENPNNHPSDTTFNFSHFIDLRRAGGLTFPNEIWSSGQYKEMFMGCKNLTEAPTLPSRNLSYECYKRMFRDCTSLIDPPILPATECRPYCYQEMFYNTGVTRATNIKAVVAAQSCCQEMYRGCKDLTYADLPLQRLAQYWGSWIFYDCMQLSVIRIHWVVTQYYWRQYCSGFPVGVRLSGVTLYKPTACEYLPYSYQESSSIPTGWTVINE